MKLNKCALGLAAVAVLALTSAARAQTTTTNASGGTTTIANPLTQLEGVIPPGATLPAFDPNGLDFTNVSYKVASGLEYNTGGGTLAYLQFDADLYHGSAVDLGAGASATLSATGSGLHSAEVNFEVIKNFSNFELTGKVGIGGELEGVKALFGDVTAQVDYNLTSGAGISFLGGKNGFTYVGANVEARVDGFTGGNANLEKIFHAYVGFAF